MSTNQLVTGFIAGIVVLVGLFFLAVLNGTILWLLYPCIFDMFPNAAKAGVLAPTLGWQSAVGITYIFGILIKSSNSNTNSNKKD